MKTIIYTMEVTVIVPDSYPEEVNTHEVEEVFEKELGVDDVVITKVQVFGE